MWWANSIYLDAALPYGVRSAPKIFSGVSNSLLWALHASGADLSLHYLDGFLLLGPPDSPACAKSLKSILSLCDFLGVPVAEEKMEGPSITPTISEIEIDTVLLQFRLPHDKLFHRMDRLAHWMRSGPNLVPRRSGTNRDLLSLIGLLNHAASVVQPGRTFLRSLINAASSVKPLDHHVHLSPRA